MPPGNDRPTPEDGRKRALRGLDPMHIFPWEPNEPQNRDHIYYYNPS